MTTSVDPYSVWPRIGDRIVKDGAGDEYRRENPADISSTVTVTREASVGEVGEAIEAARAVSDGDPAVWVRNHELRRDVLLETARLLRERTDELALMMTREIGMPLRMSLPHIGAAAEVFEFYAGYVGKDYGQAMQLANGSVISLLYEPVGVVGVIVPWNFPFKQAARKLAPALAAGCTAVVKPSPFTNASTQALIDIIVEAGAPAGVVSLVPGSKAEIGAAITSHPSVDMVSFTGSTAVGVAVQKSCADTLKRTALELGGKNPAIVCNDADLEAAANGIVYGMFLNSGQACGSVSRLLVQADVHKDFVSRITQLLQTLKLGDPQSVETSLGPVVSTRQRDVVKGFISRAHRDGLTFVTGGQESELANQGYFIPPAIVDNVPPDHELAQGEIFGPVLSVIPFKNDDEAIAIANGTQFGLTAAVWTQDHARALRIAREVKSGTIWINDNYQQNVEGIWGGFKMSGLGRELSEHGYLEMVSVKEYYSDGTSLTMKPHYLQVLNPPTA